MVVGPRGGDGGLGTGGLDLPGRAVLPRWSTSVLGGVAGEIGWPPKLGTASEEGALSIGDGGGLPRPGPTVAKEKGSPSDLQLQEVEAKGLQPETCMASPALAGSREMLALLPLTSSLNRSAADSGASPGRSWRKMVATLPCPSMETEYGVLLALVSLGRGKSWLKT